MGVVVGGGGGPQESELFHESEIFHGSGGRFSTVERRRGDDGGNSRSMPSPSAGKARKIRRRVRGNRPTDGTQKPPGRERTMFATQ